MAGQVREAVLLLMLAVCSGQDLRRQQVWLPIPACGILTGILLTAFCGDLSAESVVGGILIGAGMVLLSLPTKGGIGCGDGWVLAAAGALTGAWQSLMLLMTALLLLLPVSAALLVSGRKRKTDSVAFVPFLLAADFLMLVL